MVSEDVRAVVKRVTNRITSEQLLVLAVLAFSGYTFIESFNYSWEAAVFPRFAAAVTIVGCLLILTRNYLPYPISLFFAEGGELMTAEDVSPNEVDGVDTSEPVATDRRLNPVTVMIILLTAFAVSGYLVGLLWVAPLFIAVFGWWFDIPLPIIALLIALALVVVLGFQSIFNIRMDQGILIDSINTVELIGELYG